MKVRYPLYSKTYRTIEAITSNENWASLVQNSEAINKEFEVTDFLVSLKSLLKDIRKVYLNASEPPVYTKLIELFEDNKEIIEELNIINYRSHLFFFKIGAIVEESIDQGHTISVNPKEFCLVEVSDMEFMDKAFCHFNNVEANKTIAYIAFPNIDLSVDNFSEIISNSSFNGDALCLILNMWSDEISSGKYIITHNDSDSKNSAISALKLHLVINGRVIHEPVITQKSPESDIKSLINPSNKYQQFNEVIDILSEYNSRKEVLNKFISLYHVVENFMVRHPIVELEKRNNGRVFNMRDFKSLDLFLESSEKKNLDKLIKSSFRQVLLGKSIQEYSLDKFKGLEDNGSFDIDEFDDFATRLGLKKENYFSSTKGNVNAFPAAVSKAIYFFRNAIVHNKETEVHISNETLSITVKTFITDFLFYVMERISFGLLIKENDCIWYRNSSLLLYSD